MQQPVREVTINKWISEGWEIVKSDLVNFIVLTLILELIFVAANFTKFATLILSGPLFCSYYWIIFNKMRGGRIDIGDLAKGFSFFVPALLASLLVGVFAAIGFVFCIVPGLIVMAMYMFTFPLIIEKNLGFWDAMEESRKIIWPNIVNFTLFLLVNILIGLLGVLLCGVGTLVTTPIVLCAIACAYRDFVGLQMPATPPTTTV